jgi:hypothetical protein
LKTINFLALNAAKFTSKTAVLLLTIAIAACSPDDGPSRQNPYLPDISFRLSINLNLPEYNSLNFPGNSYSTYNSGINGVVIYNVNNTQFTAFELSDPNHPLRDCSRLSVQGVIATCNFDDKNSYNILT